MGGFGILFFFTNDWYSQNYCYFHANNTFIFGEEENNPFILFKLPRANLPILSFYSDQDDTILIFVNTNDRIIFIQRAYKDIL